jgi:quinol monooxygenase YgiN
MIHVVAVITAKPGQRAAVLDAFNRIVPFVREEQGCLEYGPAIDVAGGPDNWHRLGPDTFIVIEKWESEAALQAHAVAPHMVEYGSRVKDLVASRAIHVLDPV